IDCLGGGQELLYTDLFLNRSVRTTRIMRHSKH
ncbi:unnamed protein product, partial [marine sediment metagenome]